MERGANMNLYYLNKFFYLIGNDKKISQIEEILHCQICNQKGLYYPRFTSYLIKYDCDESKLQQLENTIKKNCALKYNPDTKNWILKVYHYSLPKFLPFQ